MWNLSKANLSIWKTACNFPFLEDGFEFFCVFFQIDRRIVSGFHFLSNQQGALKPSDALGNGRLGAGWAGAGVHE